MKIRHNPSSTILGELPVEEVLHKSMTQQNSSHTIHDGRKYSITRMKVFALHGCKCVFCGIEGTKIILTQDNGGGLHLDLYAENKNGYTLMNRDHILPASKGGQNNVWNMRPLCAPCNTKRGNTYTFEDQRLFTVRNKMAKIYNYLRRRRVAHKWSYRLSRWVAPVLA